MTTEAIDNAVTKLTNALEAGIKAAGTLGEKYGPEVVDAGLWVVRMNGINTLVCGIACLALAPIAFKGMIYFWRIRQKAFAQYMKPDGNSDDGVGSGAVSIFMAALVGLFSVVAVVNLLNVWTYVAIFEPKVWVAKRLLGL